MDVEKIIQTQNTNTARLLQRIDEIAEKTNSVIRCKNDQLNKAKELLRQCMKYHLHPEVSEYPYNEVEVFLKEVES